MDPVLLGIIVTGVLGIAAGAGFWGFLSSRLDRPLKVKEVDNSALTVIQTGYAGLLKDLREDLDRVGTEVDSQGDQIKELRAEVRGLRVVNDRLQALLRTAGSWIDDIHVRWDWHREQPSPPAKPDLHHGYDE